MCKSPRDVIGTVPVAQRSPWNRKSIFAHAYGKLWGPHYITLSHQEHTMGRFGAHLTAKRLALLTKDRSEVIEKWPVSLKPAITETKIILEMKGIDAIQLDNHMIFIFASNEENVVPADIADRRWMFFEVGTQHERIRSILVR